MIKLKFKVTDQYTLKNKLGLGTWGFGGEAYGPITENDALKIIVKAIEQGVRFLDTAPLYGSGRSESLIGEAIREIGTDFTIATKFGLYMEQGVEVRFFSQERLKRSLIESTERLNKVPDILLAHSPYITELQTVYKYMENLQREGGPSMGVSLRAPSDYSEFTSFGLEFKFYECNFSLMDHRILEKCKNSGFKGSFIARTVLNYGFLTDTPPLSLERHSNKYQIRRFSIGTLQRWHAESLMWREIADYNNLTLQQFAILFVISHDFIDKAVIGCMNIVEVKELLEVSSLGLFSEETLREIHNFKYYVDNKLGPVRF